MPILYLKGFVDPTDVQMGSLPLLLGSGDDGEKGALKNKCSLESLGLGDSRIHVITVAPTGSGKTLAYVIPLIDSLLRRRKQIRNDQGEKALKEDKGIKAIVLSPTRELANQIVNEFRKLLVGTGITVIGLKKSMLSGNRRTRKKSQSQDDVSSEDDSIGEEDINEEDLSQDDVGSEVKEARYSAVKSDILVATPLLLLHAIESISSVINVSNVEHCVLDEADAPFGRTVSGPNFTHH